MNRAEDFRPRLTAIFARHNSSYPFVYVAAGALLIFLVLAVGNALTRAPWWDEGLFADVAMNFRNYGHLGSSTLTPTGFLRFPEAHRYTYWQFPLYLVTLGYWIRLVPSTIEWMRLLSTFFGLLYAAAWFFLVRALGRNSRLAFFVASIVMLDYSIVSASSDARMDMMCAALGQCALAVYASWRKTNWRLAVSLAAWFSAGSLFCHPMGFLMNGLLACLVLWDWRKVKWTGLLAATVPYLVGGALCYRYALEAPKIFWAQSTAASSARTSSLLVILQKVLNDPYRRYFAFYFQSLTGVNKLKVFSLLFAIFGFLALLLDRRLALQPLHKALLILSAAACLGVAVIDNQKLPIYLVYAMPFFTACGAVWMYEGWQHKGSARIFSLLLLIGFLGSTIGGFAFKIYKNEYRSVYLPAVEAMQRSLPPGGTAMGGSELGFAFGFSPRLIDDRYLGFGSQVMPEIFVSNYYYGEPPGAHLHEAWLWSRHMLQNRYRPIFQNSAYVVYLRNDVAQNSAKQDSALAVSPGR